MRLFFTLEALMVLVLAFLFFFPETVNALIPADKNGDATTWVFGLVIGVPFILMIFHVLFLRERSS